MSVLPGGPFRVRLTFPRSETSVPKLKTSGARHRATREKRGKLRRACRLVEPFTADPYGGWCGGWEL